MILLFSLDSTLFYECSKILEEDSGRGGKVSLPPFHCILINSANKSVFLCSQGRA